MAISVIRTKKLIGKRVVTPIKSIDINAQNLFGWANPDAWLTITPLASISDRGIMTYAQPEQQQAVGPSGLRP